MKDLNNRIALAALERARNQRLAKLPRNVINSRTADKFVIRGYLELFEALSQIGQHHGRSQNSEVVAAILESLQGYRRSSMVIDALVIKIGDKANDEIQNSYQKLDPALLKTPHKFVVRLPPNIRDTIREDIALAIEAEQHKSLSMNQWLVNALVEWVNVQRRMNALIECALDMDSAPAHQSRHWPEANVGKIQLA